MAKCPFEKKASICLSFIERTGRSELRRPNWKAGKNVLGFKKIKLEKKL